MFGGAGASSLSPNNEAIEITFKNFNFYYGKFQALKNINLEIYKRRVTALIGPSGCGKSTYLRCFNRMHDLYPGNRYEGEIRLHPDNTNLLDRRWTRSKCACASAWCSRSRIPFRSRSTRTSRMACACAASAAGRAG